MIRGGAARTPGTGHTARVPAARRSTPYPERESRTRVDLARLLCSIPHPTEVYCDEDHNYGP